MRFGKLLLLGVLIWHFSGESSIATPKAIREGSTIVCREGSSERISLRSTDRLPEASGAVQVECKGGTTELEVEVDSIAPITLDAVTPSLARACGFASVADLLKVAKHGQGENVYLVRFHYIPR